MVLGSPPPHTPSSWDALHIHRGPPQTIPRALCLTSPLVASALMSHVAFRSGHGRIEVAQGDHRGEGYRDLDSEATRVCHTGSFCPHTWPPA